MVRSATATAKAASETPPEDEQITRWSRVLQAVVGRFDTGSLTIDLPSGRSLTFTGERPGHNAQITVRRWRALPRIALSGDIGFADSLAAGDCYSNDLKTFLLWALDNCSTPSSPHKGTVGDGLLASRLAARVRHAIRANTRSNSRRNIAAHYDLGNAFYASWLDKDLNYSSGIYDAPSATLEQAQAKKIQRIADFLQLRGGEKVLEVGCGWGALAHHLISRYRCQVTGLTLSQEQQNHAREHLGAFGLRADIRLEDYRDVTGTFDRVVSIEMIEAVGEAYWPGYFRKIASSLSSQGMAVLQAITIDERFYEDYRRRPDFIQLSIFPGGMLPTKSIIAEQAKQAGLRLTRAEHFGASYARTLADWRLRFDNARPRLLELGFDDRFIRLWDYYLTYCEVGFESRRLDVGLYQLRREN